jgi:hypothetical protein
MKISDCVGMDEELERLCYSEREGNIFRTKSDAIMVNLNQLESFFCTN